jgi:hypothetical protein
MAAEDECSAICQQNSAGTPTRHRKLLLDQMAGGLLFARAWLSPLAELTG